jgi:hypothetical protein
MVINYLKSQMHGYQVQLDRARDDLARYSRIVEQSEREIEGIKLMMRLVQEKINQYEAGGGNDV